jgi:predicted TPR repeat methyltransferase
MAQRTADALASYERAIRLAPQDADGWIGKAEALVQSGRRAEAIAAFHEALRVRPGYLAASLRLKRVERDIGRSQSDAKGGS